jgi:hypothetical protein
MMGRSLEFGFTLSAEEEAEAAAGTSKISASWTICGDCPSPMGCKDLGACRRVCRITQAALEAGEKDWTGASTISAVRDRRPRAWDGVRKGANNDT